MNYKKFSLLNILFLLIALWLAAFLLVAGQWKDATLDHSLVFVLDVNRTMNTEDVSLDTKFVSRLDAAKHIIQTTIDSEPGFSYGLVIFNGWTDYIVPATFDTWTLLLYLSGITTNLLPESDKNLDSLADIIDKKALVSYIVLSDFDADVPEDLSLPQATSLIGLWSKQGDYVRYSNGVRYYDSGASVSSVRNDAFADLLWCSYTTLINVEDFRPQQLIFGWFHLPLSQRIILYVILGILVIFAIML